MGSNGHVDSAIESAVFQWLFLWRFGNFNFTLVRGKRETALLLVVAGQSWLKFNLLPSIESSSAAILLYWTKTRNPGQSGEVVLGREKPVRSFRGCSHRVSGILRIARAERCVILVRAIVPFSTSSPGAISRTVHLSYPSAW